jgi:hypothetical protein
MELLGISRQGQPRERLPLKPPAENPAPLAHRLMWFVALWLSGVGTVALVAYVLRLWIAPK